jgi:CheY-like chemotaxis protein
MEKLILIVDDDRTFRSLLRDLLEVQNFCVIEAKDGRTALKLAANLNPHLIICDIDMPVMSGLEVLKLLRQDLNMKSIPVIMLTDNSVQRYQTLAFELGADAYLIKSAFSKSFLTVVSEQLNLKRVELS